MRLFFIFFITFLLTMICPTNKAKAEIPIKLEYDFFLPDTFSTIGIHLKDVDMDGTIDMLLKNQLQYGSYSFVNDDVLSFFRYKKDTIERKYISGYYDKDYYHDFIEVIKLIDSSMIHIYAIKWFSNDTIPDTTLIYSTDTPQLGYLLTPTLSDFDNDGDYDLSAGFYWIDSVYWYPSLPPILEYHSNTFIYDFNYPVNTSITSKHNYDELIEVDLFQDSIQEFVYIESDVNEYDDYVNDIFTSSITSKLSVIKEDTNLFKLQFDPTKVCYSHTLDPGSYNKAASISSYNFLDFLPSDEGKELLLSVDYSSSNIGIWGSCFSDSIEINCYNLDTSTPLLLWSIEVPRQNQNLSIHTDENYQNQFFIISGNDYSSKVYLYDTGSQTIIDSTLTINGGRWIGSFQLKNGTKAFMIGGGRKYSVYSFDISTDINDNNPNNLPTGFTLSQNYPNPFNPTTVIEYSLPSKGVFRAEIFNLLGQRVAILIDKQQSAGIHQITWDASNQSSGMYLFKVSYDDQTKSIKTLLLK